MMIDISKGRYWDMPWSLVDGCTPCSPGCAHCWSAAMAKRFNPDLTLQLLWIDKETGKPMPPAFNGKIITHPDRLSIPLKRQKPTVYAVWNDLFHEAVPVEFIDQVFNEIGFHYIHHTFLILSKRPRRMLEYSKRLQTVATHPLNPFPNVWWGLTVCTQQEADEKIPSFLRVPGKKFLSIEPMLGAIDIRIPAFNGADSFSAMAGIDAVILGGETGPGARPMHPVWVRSIRDQCAAAGVPFFFKQWGEWVDFNHPYDVCEDRRYKIGSMPQVFIDGKALNRIGKKNAGRLLDDRTHDDLPWVKP